ncbi:MAG: sigma factor-like helix-turn-helix DNA-binding protein [Candidatus Spechtbacterales bacterium]|nr:sigma factor-like helix-turn-helix DNA-binding protein [Candidatus Spechtbacterales bacterium]
MSTTSSEKLNVKPLIEKVLGILSERNGAILAARHGIGEGGERRTLESIGQDYDITRERVRQIEEASYTKIRNSEDFELLESAFASVIEFLNEHGGAVSEEYLFDTLTTEGQQPHLALLMALNKDFTKIKENDYHKAGWAVNKERAGEIKKLLANAAKKIKKKGDLISDDELVDILQSVPPETVAPDQETVHAVLSLSKHIEKGPYGEWGLADWPEVNPRGVRDKVYLVLKEGEEPLHFRKLATMIDDGPFEKKSGKNTHPQTVHNELIKDDRFVLIGRGVYALREWGYMPGTVKDVIMNILQEEGKPLHKEKLVSKVLEQRRVQTNTILLNLQNKDHFAKVDGDHYYLA